jgi:hypothetical protein
MKVLHLIVGLLLVVIFLLTGQYMLFHNPKMEELSDGMRMLFRSRHIYILLAGLLNLGIGSYFSYRQQRWRRVLQIIGSCFIIGAPFLSVGAFFHEPQLPGLRGPLTLPAIIALFVGTFLHLLSGAWQRRKPTAT